MKAITKMVKKYGNSGGVYVPSSWVGGKVKVELVDEPFSVNNIFNKIVMKHVVSVILYGSYARKEAAKDSDIDIILIRDEDAEIAIPDELKQKYDIQIKTTEEARNAMAHDPIFYKLIKDESIALINHQFLDNLRKVKLKPGGIKVRIGLAESSLNIIREIFSLGGDDILYPLIMRIKEMLVLECLLYNKKYFTVLLRNDILSCGLSQKEFFGVMNIYKAARNNKKQEKYAANDAKRLNISRETIEKLISLLETKIKYVKQKAV